MELYSPQNLGLVRVRSRLDLLFFHLFSEHLALILLNEIVTNKPGLVYPVYFVRLRMYFVLLLTPNFISESYALGFLIGPALCGGLMDFVMIHILGWARHIGSLSSDKEFVSGGDSGFFLLGPLDLVSVGLVLHVRIRDVVFDIGFIGRTPSTVLHQVLHADAILRHFLLSECDLPT